MNIRLTADVSGSRNGAPWPARGTVVELPDDEAALMCKSGMAVPVNSSRDGVKTATVDDDSEQRGLTTMSAASLVPNQQDTSGALIPVEKESGDKEATAAPKTAPAKTVAAKKAAAKPPASGK